MTLLTTSLSGLKADQAEDLELEDLPEDIGLFEGLALGFSPPEPPTNPAVFVSLPTAPPSGGAWSQQGYGQKCSFKSSHSASQDQTKAQPC